MNPLTDWDWASLRTRCAGVKQTWNLHFVHLLRNKIFSCLAVFPSIYFFWCIFCIKKAIQQAPYSSQRAYIMMNFPDRDKNGRKWCKSNVRRIGCDVMCKTLFYNWLHPNIAIYKWKKIAAWVNVRFRMIFFERCTFSHGMEVGVVRFVFISAVQKSA